jgi:prephenate dehydratase
MEKRKQMKSLRIAFQGEPGAYSELAAIEHFGSGVDTIPCESFEKAFHLVSSGEADRALLPFENSLAGSIHRNYDLILRHELYIVSEYHLRVQHCLMGLAGANLADIREVYSHPQALAQCERNLSELGVDRIPSADTAGSARNVREWSDMGKAAIASKRAAKVYGLNILRQNFEDNPSNFTRFLALSLSPFEVDLSENEDCKTSVVFSLENQPGALFKALSVFALRDIDLTKIESRPIQGKPWEYMFYIDFLGHRIGKNSERALDHLGELAQFLRVLGSYPRHPIR